MSEKYKTVLMELECVLDRTSYSICGVPWHKLNMWSPLFKDD